MAFDGEGYFAGEFDVELQLVEEQVQLYLVPLEVEGRVGLPHAYKMEINYIKVILDPVFFFPKNRFPLKTVILDAFAIAVMKNRKKDSI